MPVIYQKCYVLLTGLIYMFCMELRTNRAYFRNLHSLLGFRNRDWVCLQRGTDWIFKQNFGF